VRNSLLVQIDARVAQGRRTERRTCGGLDVDALEDNAFAVR
jgi:hypothetical protein